MQTGITISHWQLSQMPETDSNPMLTVCCLCKTMHLITQLIGITRPHCTRHIQFHENIFKILPSAPGYKYLLNEWIEEKLSTLPVLKISILCQTPSARFWRGRLTLVSPLPWSIRNLGCPPTNSKEIKSVGSSDFRAEIGPLYMIRPLGSCVRNSMLVWLSSHCARGSNHAQPFPAKLCLVCWHRGPSKPARHSHLKYQGKDVWI